MNKLHYEEISIEITDLSSADVIATSAPIAIFGFSGKDDNVDYDW